MDLFVEPLQDSESYPQVGPGSHACEKERSSSSSLSKTSNSSPDSIKDVDYVGTTNTAVGVAAMQQYNTQHNMAYDDSSSRYSFHGTAATATQESATTPNMMLNFGFQGDQLSANGLLQLEHNLSHRLSHSLSGSFTGDLNSDAYEVGDPADHGGILLHEMLQPSQPHSAAARLPADEHSQVPGAAATNGDWEDSLHALQEMVHLQQQQQQQQQQQHHHHLYNNNNTQPQPEHSHFPTFSPRQPHRQMEHHTLTKYPSSDSVDLLNLLHFPRVAPPTFSYPSVQGKAPLYSGTNTESFQLPQRLFQRGTEGARNGLLGDLEPEDASGKSKREGKGGEARGVNHFATERQRREFLNEKYHTLRSLVPNPTKADRASIVADAIEYVKELKQMVQELQQSVEEKRRAAGDASSVKRRRSSMDGEPYNTTKTGGSSPGPENDGHLMTGNDRFSSDGSQQQQQRCSSSCLQRTSPSGAHVDVRVVHDEVTIKVNHRRRPSSLLFSVLAVLQDLQLDLFHASGASIGEHDVFLFNTKIIEGSSTFASYIGVKLLDTLIAIL